MTDPSNSEVDYANCTDCGGKFYEESLHKVVRGGAGDHFLCNDW
jgi:hypothetical protein